MAIVVVGFLLTAFSNLHPTLRAVAVLSTALILTLSVSTLVSWFRLRHVPGPRWHGFSALFLTITHLKGTPHSDIMEWSLKYGPLVRVAHNTTSTSDFRAMQRISSAKSRYYKSGWYGAWRMIKGQDHSFSTVDEHLHTAFRNKISSGYRGSQAMEEAVDRQVIRLIDVISRQFVMDMEDKAETSRIMDIALASHMFALDVVGDLTYGKAFGFLDRCEDFFGFIDWNDDFFSVAAVASTLPSLAKITNLWPFSEFLPKKTDKLGLGRFIGHSDKVIRNRYAHGKSPRNDLIDDWIRMGVTIDEAINQTLVQITAGTDSVAVVLRMIILWVSTNPRVYNKLMAELDAYYAARPSDAPPLSNTEARKLPYLQAVIREGMRIFPGSQALGIKSVPSGGDTVCGYSLPAGTGVGLDIWAAMRRKEFWGEDSRIFRPERWTEVEAMGEDGKEKLQEMIECLEFQFGYGRYQCLGKWVVATELNKAVPALLRRFHFTPVNPLRPTVVKSAGFYIMHDFDMIVTARSHG